MAGLIRVGGEWKPTELVEAKNLISTLQDKIRIQQNVYKRASLEQTKVRRLEIINDLQAQLTAARERYDLIRDYFKSPEGSADVQQSYSNLPSYVHGNLDTNAITVTKPVESSSTVEPFTPNNTGLLVGGGIGILVILFIIIMIMRRKN